MIADDKRQPLPEAKPTGPLVYVRLHYGHRGRELAGVGTGGAGVPR